MLQTLARGGVFLISARKAWDAVSSWAWLPSGASKIGPRAPEGHQHDPVGACRERMTGCVAGAGGQAQGDTLFRGSETPGVTWGCSFCQTRRVVLGRVSLGAAEKPTLKGRGCHRGPGPSACAVFPQGLVAQLGKVTGGGTVPKQGALSSGTGSGGMEKRGDCGASPGGWGPAGRGARMR